MTKPNLKLITAIIISCIFAWNIVGDFITEPTPDLVAKGVLNPQSLAPQIVWAGQFHPDKVVYHVVGGRFGDGFCIETSSK